MPFYYKLGNIPHKRHTQFRKANGELYSEQLFSTEGFSNDYSIMYHCHPPTQIIKTEPQQSVAPTVAEEKCCSTAALKASKLSRKRLLDSRKPVLVNNDCHIVLAAPKESMTEYFYKNTDADEMIFCT